MANKLNRRLKVWWETEGEWYEGKIVEHNDDDGQTKVLYDDGDEEWIDLSTAKVAFLDKLDNTDNIDDDDDKSDNNKDAAADVDKEDDPLLTSKDDNNKDGLAGGAVDKDEAKYQDTSSNNDYIDTSIEDQQGEENIDQISTQKRHTLIINLIGKEIAEEINKNDIQNDILDKLHVQNNYNDVTEENEDGDIIYKNAFEIFFLDKNNKQIRNKLVYAPEFCECFRLIFTEKEINRLNIIKFETKDNVVKYIIDIRKENLINGEIYNKLFEYQHQSYDTLNHCINIQISYKQISLYEISSKIKYSIRKINDKDDLKEDCWNENKSYYDRTRIFLNYFEDLWLTDHSELVSNFVTKKYGKNFDYDNYVLPNLSQIESMPHKSDVTNYDNHYSILNDYMIEQVTSKEQVRLYYDNEVNLFYTLPLCSENIAIGGSDVTHYVRILLRMITLQDVVLKYDSEFNIYRSYVISQNDKSKISMSLLGLILQIALTAAIVFNFIDSISSNGFLYYFDSEPETIIKILISLLVYSLVSYKHAFTVDAYCQFYEWTNYFYIIPKYLLYSDFISNILISYIVTFLCFFFLVTSETFSDLVLNSFALTFITEIDDMINIFEMDGDVLIEDDIKQFRMGLYQNRVPVEYKFKHFSPLLYAPFGTILSTKRIWDARRNLFC